MEKILFYGFSGIAIFSAFLVVFLPNMTRALLSLILVMFSLTVLYLLLGAPFIAMVNLIVYAGAILVLFLFVIMLQGVGAKDLPLKERFRKGYLFLAFFCGTFFTYVFLKALVKNPIILKKITMVGSVENVGQRLFLTYLLPFEVISVVLLVGIFAAVILAKKEKAE